MNSYFKSFIPQKISNNLVLVFFEFLRKIAFHNFPDNLEKNIKNFKNHIKEIKDNDNYIETQDDYNDMYYGNQTISFCGCEIIATYNAIYDLTGLDAFTNLEHLELSGNDLTKNSKKVYHIGDEVKIKVVNADKNRQIIDFEVIDGNN